MCVARQASDFDGTWVLWVDGQAVFKLSLTAEKGGVKGELTKPSQLQIDQDGDVRSTGPDLVKYPVQKAALKGGRLKLTIDDDRFVLTMEAHNRVSMVMEGMRPWHLERSLEGSSVILASRLQEPEYSPEIRALREQLRLMVGEDQEARLAFHQARMEAVDIKNRSAVVGIFERYGWVTNSLAGKDAAHNFWLIVQHQTPEIQQQLLPALETAAKGSNASVTDYAYLYDRVQMGLARPQHWGTQAKCKNGKPVLYPVDDRAHLDLRRKELFMLPVRAYLQLDYLVKSCAQTGN
jgi:hypothetical protein